MSCMSCNSTQPVNVTHSCPKPGHGPCYLCDAEDKFAQGPCYQCDMKQPL